MGKPLRFKQFTNVDHRPGEDDSISYRAQRRKRTDEDKECMICKDCGCEQGSAEPGCDCPHDCDDPSGNHWVAKTNEALDLIARLKKSRVMKRIQKRLQHAKKRAMRKMPSRKVMMQRVQKQARKAMGKILLRGVAKSDVNVARKKEIEKRLDTSAMRARVKRMAIKSFGKYFKQERERKKN